MTFASPKSPLNICLACIILLASCTFTTARTKDAVFNGDQAKVAKDLDSIVTCEHVNLNGREITINKKADTELEISIINGQKIPADDAGMKALGKLIATAIKNDLKDPKEYNTYKVLFIRQVKDGGIVRKTWKGNVFAATEL
jgi:hypothetical protein